MALETLKRDASSDVHLFDAPVDEESDEFSRIRCPLCHWRPSAASVWCCVSHGTPEPFFESCGTVWNTFATGGRCPGCAHQWRWTSCHRCEQWSPHHEWYDATSEHD